MRDDMHRVVFGASKHKASARNERLGRRPDIDDMPANEGIRAGRRRGHNLKSTRLRSNPLRRFLERRVGNSWDAVHSELVAAIPCKDRRRDSVVNLVAWMVETNTALQDGEVVFLTSVGPCRGTSSEFYVDPATGALRRTAGLRNRWAAPPAPERALIIIDAKTELHRLDGIWYEIGFEPFPDPVVRTYIRYDGSVGQEIRQTVVFDLLKGRLVSSGTRYAATKRQLSGQELRTFELRNLTN